MQFFSFGMVVLLVAFAETGSATDNFSEHKADNSQTTNNKQKPLLETLLKSLDSHHACVRTSALHALKDMGSVAREALPNLIKLLNDSDERVRAAAVEAIIRVDITNPIAQPGLLKAMRDPSVRVQYAANKALVELGPVNIEVIRALIQAIRDNTKSFNNTSDYKGPEYNIVPVSKDIIRRLDTQNYFAASDFIALAKDSNPGVQRLAMIALSNIGSVPKEFIPMLMENVRNSASVWAVNALVCLGPEAESEVPALLEMLRDKQPVIRDAAARILAAISCPEGESVTPSMEEYIKMTGTIPLKNPWKDLLILNTDSTTEDDQQKKDGVFFKHKLSSTTIRSAKATARAEVNARKKSGPGLRYRRPPGMENLDSDEAIAETIKACMHDFEDDSKVTYETALRRLHYLGDRAFDALTTGLKSGSYRVKMACGEELVQLGPKATPFLREANRNECLVEYKEYLNWPPELRPIYQLTLDAETLAGEQFGNAEIKQLIQQITSDNPYVSEGCILALGELRAESAVPAITSLSPKKPGVCFALAMIASRDAITFLLNAVQSSDKEDCNAAVYAMQQYAGRWAVPVLIEMLDDPRLIKKALNSHDLLWDGDIDPHCALEVCLDRLGVKSQQHCFPDKYYFDWECEIWHIQMWWKKYGKDFLQGKYVPNPNLTGIFIYD